MSQSTNQQYKCVNCGYEMASNDLSSIRCPKCEYKGLELAQGSTNPKDDLDEMLLQYEISGKDGIAREEFLTQMQEYITLARIDAMKRAKSRVLRRTEIPSDAKNPTRDVVVITGEECARIIDLDIDELEAALQRDSPPNVSPTIQNPERVSENGVSDSQPGGTDE